MQYKRRKNLLAGIGFLLTASVLLAACGGSEPATPAATPISEVAQVAPTDTPEQSTDTPVPTPTTAEPAQPTNTLLPAPTEAPVPTEALVPTDTIVPPTDTPEPAPAVVSIFGQTDDGLYFRGNPDPDTVTVIDYSDFL